MSRCHPVWRLRHALGVLTILLSACSQGVEPEQTRELAVQGAYSAALSSSSRYALLGSIQHGGSLWDISAGERLYNWNHRGGEYSSLVALAFSPDEQYAVSAEQRSLVLWSLSDGTPQGYWRAPGGVLDLDLSNNGSFALLGLDDQTAVYFNIRAGGVVRTLPHGGRVRAVSLSHDQAQALTGADDNQARLWDLGSGQLLHSVGHGNHVNTVALSPNGQWAFSAGQLDKAVLWNTGSGALVHTLTTSEALLPQRISYSAARFSPTSDRLLTGTTSGLIQLWDVRQGRELKRWQAAKRDPFRPTSAFIYALGFSNDGYYALASNGLLNLLR